MLSISVVSLTYRPGGIDILADALANQTYKNYELIIVDDYKPDRSDEIRKYLAAKGVGVSYIGPSKRKCFEELPFGIFNAVNTGFAHARGDVVSMVTDYQWFPPDCLEKIAKQEAKLRNKTCIVLPGRFWASTAPRNNNGVISIWSQEWKGPPAANGCWEGYKPWIPEGMEFAFTTYPWQVLEDMNGFPEYLDAVSSQPYEPIMEVFNSVGAKAFVDTDNFFHGLYHRDWQPPELWYQSARKGSAEVIKRPNTFNLRDLRKAKA